jgi:hypothetical protein
MFIRIDVGTTPQQKLDEFTAFIGDEVVPELRKLNGYRSTTVGVERIGGTVVVSTDWDTSEDRETCDAVLATVLKNAGRFELTPVRIEFYQRVFEDSV